MEDRDEIIKAAHQYASKGQINDAIAEYLKILPYSVDGNIRNVIGDLYLKNKSTDEAIKYFREAAAIFNKEESHAKAIALYHKILSINPDQHAVEMELAELNAERGFITQAIEGMSRAAEAYYSKGLPMKALGVYKKALKLCPSNIELKFIIADLHLEVNHTDRAVKLYLTIAMEYEANAESARAEHMYKKVFSLDPDNIESLTHLSRLAEDDQDLELALEYMSKAAAIAPHNSEIMLEYSNLEQKANKDISESSQRVHDGPDHKEPQNIHIPDAVHHYNKTDNTHEPLDLSLESSNTGNLHSGKPISSSSSQLPVTSTGSDYEETGFAVPPDTVDTGIEKNGIWDNSPDEDNSNPSVIDSIEGKTSNVIPGHETAEAEYDQHTEKNDLNMSIKKTDHNKSIKDSQRLKRRVKTNRVHVLLIVIFTCITAISFFITFKFIKNAQTVDVETPEHVISPEPYNHNNGEDIDILHNESTITDLNTADEQSIKKPVSLNSGKYPQEINQDELTLPDRESDTPGIDSDILPDDSIDIALEEEGNNYSNNTEDTIVSTMKPDRDAIHVTEEPQVIIKGLLTVPVKESDTPGIDSDILPDDSIDIALEEEGNNYSNNTEDTIVSTMKPDSDAIHVTEEPLVIDKGKLTVPVKESDSPGIDSEILPDNSIDIAPEQEGNNYSNNTEDTIASTMKPDRDAIHVTEEPQVIIKGLLTVPVKESDSPGIDSEILPDNSIDIAPEQEGNNYSNNTEDTIVSTMKPDRDAIHVTEEPQVIIKGLLTVPVKESDSSGIDSEILPDNSIDIAPEQEGNNYSNNTEDTIASTIKPDRDAIHVTEEPQVINKGLITVPVKESDSPGIDSEILPDNSIDIAPEQEGNNYSNNTEDTIVSTLKPDREIAQEQEKTHIDTETLNVPETKDEMQQQEEHKEEKTALISFNEFFDNNNNNWDIVETSAASVRLENGKYYIRNGRSSGAYIILNGPYISTDLDFEVESHLDSVDPSEDHTYGLIFGAKNKEDFFVFQIRPGNNYSIKKYFRGVALELAGGKINSRPEAQDLYNVLKITCKDNKLSFFINENFIDEVPDIYFSRRKTGLFIDSNAEIVVDKILLHQQPR